MFRGYAIITVIGLCALTGCRAAPPAVIGDSGGPQKQASGSSQAHALKQRFPVNTVGFHQQTGSTAASGTGAPAVSPLTLADFERIAFQNNPTLAAAAAGVRAAQARQAQAGRFPNPVIGYHATEIGNQGTAGQQGAFISQRFITAGKLSLDQAVVGAQIAEARFRLRSQDQRVLNDVRVAFYTALVGQRRIELTGDLARLGDDLVTATRKLLDGRLGTENDLLQAEIRADEARILLDNAHSEYAAAWRRLAAVVGLPELAITPLRGDWGDNPPQFDWPTCQLMTLENHPELNAARARVQRAALAVRRAMREPIPNVDLTVSVGHHNVTDDDVANVQVGVPIPIFDKNRGNIRAARADWAAAQADAQRIELELLDQLAVAYRRYDAARKQVNRYSRSMLPKAERSLGLVTGGYDQGQVEYLTLLTAQQTYLQVNLAYLDSLRELWTAAAVIEGQLLTGSLAARP